MTVRHAWLSEDDLADRLHWPVAKVRAYVASGLFHSYLRSTGDGLRFYPEVVEFIAWHSRHADDVLAGRLDLFEFGKMVDRRQAPARLVALRRV